MFYIDQLRTPSFPIGLVKIEFGFIVRSVQTGLRRWTLVVAVISVDAYPFLAFPDLTCHREDTRIGVFWLQCRLIVRRPNLEVASKKLLHQQVKILGVVLVPCSRMEVRPYSNSRWCRYFWGPWVSFVTADEFSVRVTKITSRIGVSWTHSLPFCF